MEAEQRPGTSGRRVATAIVVIGVTAGVAALFFREFTPRRQPATPSTTAPTTTTSSGNAALNQFE